MGERIPIAKNNPFFNIQLYCVSKSGLQVSLYKNFLELKTYFFESSQSKRLDWDEGEVVVTSYELAMLLKKLMPMRTASPMPMIASPAGSAVEIMVRTSVFTVPTAVVKELVKASVIVAYLLYYFLIYANKAESLESTKS